MRVRVADLLTPELIEALAVNGLEIVRVGDVPHWMERVESMPNPVYRIKQLED